MINHIRTLLLNRTAAGTDVPGEEYVDPTFAPYDVDQPLRKIRGVLFGTDPDRYMLNYRLRQYLQILHCTELAEFVTRDDTRISYLPFPQDELYRDAFGTTVAQYRTLGGDLTPVGTLVPDDGAGRLYHQWRVVILNGTQVTIDRVTTPIDTVTLDYTLTDGRSGLLPLIGSSLQFTFSGSPGLAWIISSLARPIVGTAEILTRLRATINAADELELFGMQPEEPYKTLRNVWRDHPEFAYQLGAMLLVVAWRTAENVRS